MAWRNNILTHLAAGASATDAHPDDHTEIHARVEALEALVTTLQNQASTNAAAITALQNSVAALALLVPVAAASDAAATAAGAAGQLAIGQLVVTG